MTALRVPTHRDRHEGGTEATPTCAWCGVRLGPWGGGRRPGTGASSGTDTPRTDMAGTGTAVIWYDKDKQGVDKLNGFLLKLTFTFQ